MLSINFKEILFEKPAQKRDVSGVFKTIYLAY